MADLYREEELPVSSDEIKTTSKKIYSDQALAMLIKIVTNASLLLAFALCSFVCDAQGPQIGFSNKTPSFGNGHDYVQQLNETVNPANGSLSIHIGIPTPPGRGLSIGYGLDYNSAANFDFTQPQGDQGLIGTMALAGSYSTNGGWSDTTPRLIVEHDINSTTDSTGNPAICELYQGFIFIDPNGERHSLPLFLYTPVGSQGSGCHPGTVGSPTATPVLAAADKDYQAVFDGGLKIASADGTIYEFALTFSDGVQSGFPTGIITINPQFVEDKNGNQVTIGNGSYTGNAGIGSGSPVIDTLGRKLVTVTNSGLGIQINVAGIPAFYTFTGSSYQNQVQKTTPLPTRQNTTIYPPDRYGSCGTLGMVVQSPSGAQIGLPNGQSYGIVSESSYGLPSKITYPTGGYVSYTWSIPGMTDDAVYQWNVPSSLEPPGAVGSGDSAQPSQPYYCAMQYGLPEISHREVSFDGVNVALTQDFTYQTTFGAANDTSGWKTKTTTVVTNDLVANTSSTIIYTYIPDPNTTLINQLQRYMGPQPLENTITYQDGSGNILETVQKTFTDDVLTSQVTQMGSGLTSEKDYLYGGFAPAVLSSFAGSFTAYEMGWMSWPAGTVTYDWGNGTKGPLLNTTYNVFANPGSIPSTSLDLNEGPTILNEPLKTITQDGSGNIIAETDYQYTDTIAQSLSGIVQHDPTFEGNHSQVRRNLLSATKKCFPNCTDSVTTYSYDSTGQVVSITDANQNITTLSYADAFASGAGQPSGPTNAYLTGIASPSVGGVSHINSYTFGFADGKLRSATDENQQKTTYCYFSGGCSGNNLDAYDRLTQIIYPVGGGNALVIYNDAGPMPSVVKLVAQNSATNTLTTTVYDGMGHTIQNQSNSAPGGAIYINSSYDGFGRLFTQSNPYLAGASINTTQYQYDALGRQTSVTMPDGNTKKWQYSGNITSVTDEVGNLWKNTSDALGRLTQVIEPPGSSASYAYDPLNNLINASQYGAPGCASSSYASCSVTRSFSYDSLSRLVTSTNPEAGIICYGQWNSSTCQGGYDPNGNLLYRTDARGLTTSYNYDALNRIMHKLVPVVGSSPTTYVMTCYQYDTFAGASASANLIGRYTAEWTQTGNTCASSYTPSSALTAKVISSYDAMGRSLISQQCVLGQCQAAPFTQNQTYDLAGNMTSWTDGLGRMFQQQFDAAGRVSSVYTGPNLLFSAQQYTPANALQNWNLGNYLNFSRSYDNRLRVTGETVTH